MAKAYTLGFEAYLYIGTAPLDPPTVEIGTPGQWDNELEYVGDVTVGGSPTEADITTRQTARTGFTATVQVLEQGQIVFAVQKRNLTDALQRQLVLARKNKNPIALMALSEEKSIEGAWGYAGNYTITFEDGQPVQGVQTLNVTASLTDNSFFVEVDNLGNIIEIT